MSRVIKFRAWLNVSEEENTQEFEMIPWDKCFFSDMSPVTGWGSDFPDSDDPDCILMQFTGLFDKNGKEIYEGDIVKNRMNWIGEVKFIDGCFVFTNQYTEDCLSTLTTLKDVEVIGNIWEHPELLC